MFFGSVICAKIQLNDLIFVARAGNIKLSMEILFSLQKLPIAWSSQLQQQQIQWLADRIMDLAVVYT